MTQLYIITATSDPKWYRDSGNKTLDIDFQYYAENEKDAKQQFKDDKIISRGMRILNITTAQDHFLKKLQLNKKLYLYDEKKMKYIYGGKITHISRTKTAIIVYNEKHQEGYETMCYSIAELVKWHNESLCDIRN